MECENWSVQCGLWGVWSLERGLGAGRCEVWSVDVQDSNNVCMAGMATNVSERLASRVARHSDISRLSHASLGVRRTGYGGNRECSALWRMRSRGPESGA